VPPDHATVCARWLLRRLADVDCSPSSSFATTRPVGLAPVMAPDFCLSGRAAALHVVDEKCYLHPGWCRHVRAGPAHSHPDSHPTLCLQRPPRRLAERHPDGRRTSRRAGRHLEPGMLLHPTRTLQKAAQRWSRLCAGAETTTDTTRRAPAVVVGGGVSTGDVHVFRIATIPRPRGLRTRPIGPHCAAQKRAIAVSGEGF
jgi:hypothetical protein